MNINLHIERLVLEGLPLEQQHGPQLQAALAQELARLLSQAKTPGLDRDRHATRVDAGRIRVAQRPEPGRIGRQIAAAVYRGFGAQS